MAFCPSRPNFVICFSAVRAISIRQVLIDTFGAGLLLPDQG
jgi:hypothetical protein